MLEWRLKAFRLWQTMEEPDWAKVGYPKIDYQDAYYYAAPKKKVELDSLDDLDPEIKRVYDKLGIPLGEQEVLAGVKGAKKVAVDAVFDSVSVATSFREELLRAGVIFLSISEAIREYPDLVKKWLGRVVPVRDKYFARSIARSSGALRLCARRRALPESFRLISASMPRIPASSNAP